MRFPSFSLERYLDRYEFSAPYLLCCSDCESLKVGNLLAKEPGAEKAFLELNLGYSESSGDPKLRSLVANLYEKASARDILLFAGAQEGIFSFMQVLLEPGDEIIVQWPCYQSLFQIAENIGCKVNKWPVYYDKGWHCDFEAVKDMLKGKIRLVVVNNPHNPTGSLFSESELRELAALCSRQGTYLFSDEVYRGLEFEGATLPAAADIYERGISLGVMSKTYGLAGLRVGWIFASDKNVMRDMQAFKDYTSICNSAPSEFLSKVALKHAGDIVDRNMGIICSNLELLNEFFARNQDVFEWTSPQSGPVAFPRLLSGDADLFCREAVNETGVLLLPGSVYSEEYSDCFRIGFGRSNMPECLNVLEAYLEKKQ